MTKLEKDLKRVTKRLAIKAKAIGCLDLVIQIDDNPKVNVTILGELYDDCVDNPKSQTHLKLADYTSRALNGYLNGCISKDMLNKPFTLN
jgi:hypothetical protein